MSPPVPSTIAVLMYHSVSGPPAGPLRSLAVPPRRLTEQLTALTGAGYRLVGLTEALARAAAGDDRVVGLTFDDGYEDFLRAGLPVLAEVGATATLYPAVGHLGGPASWLGPRSATFGPLLTWDQLAEVAAAGVEIGNHSLVHHPLDVLPPAQLAREVATSDEQLRQRLGRPVRSFCYPHGYHDRAVVAVVAQAGYDNACQIGRRRYRVGTNPYAVSRLHPTVDHSGADLLRLVATGGPWLTPAVKRLAGPGWRLLRRAVHRAGGRLT